MKKNIKCENCGASLEFDQTKQVSYCPYCGFSIKEKETLYDHEKYMANFQEKVRQNIVKEKTAEERRSNRQIALIFGILILFIIAPFLFQYIPFRLEERKLERLSQNIQKSINEGYLDDAWMKSLNLTSTTNWSRNAEEKWNRLREDYQKLIKDKQKTAMRTCPHDWIPTGNERDAGPFWAVKHQLEYKCNKCGNFEWRDAE